MKHIKLREEYVSINHVSERMKGKVFKLYPSRNDKLIVIAQLIEVIGISKTWGKFKGIIVFPESKLGEKWEGDEFLSDWIDSSPTDDELEIYNYYTQTYKYNL
jgi:hypothetical protein